MARVTVIFDDDEDGLVNVAIQEIDEISKNPDERTNAQSAALEVVAHLIILASEVQHD